MKFSSPPAAYIWAQEVLIPWRQGRAFDPDPEQFHGGTGSMGAIIAAIAIDTRAERACCGAARCPQFHRECFLTYWLPEPTIVQPRRAQAEIDRIEACISKFDKLLQDAGLIE